MFPRLPVKVSRAIKTWVYSGKFTLESYNTKLFDNTKSNKSLLLSLPAFQRRNPIKLFDQLHHCCNDLMRKQL